MYRGIAMTVAGSDSGGGAGIQADLKTFAALRVFGVSSVAAVTVQNSLGVQGFCALSSEMVTGQIDAVCSDFTVGAVKTGMLASAQVVRAVADALLRAGVRHLVVDPVMVSQSGHALIEDGAVIAVRCALAPMASLITPNLPEAERLLGRGINYERPEEAAEELLTQLGCGGVLLKGGHAQGAEVMDVLATSEGTEVFRSVRIETNNTHGTGCTLSAAIAAELASGCTLLEAVRRGREYLYRALLLGVCYGHGHGCLGHAVTMNWVE